ncbi:MAG: DUF177 domain-containing protein [Parvibaculaceae bacterium]
MPQPNPTPEFSRPLDVTRVPAQGSLEAISAEPRECADLARRFGLPALHSLAAQLRVSRWRGEGLRIKGRFTADLDQTCVVSLDMFRSTVTDEFESYFLPAGTAAGADSALIEEGDAEPFENGIIDMGEVVAEAVALALDPYPKKPGVVFADVIGDEGSPGMDDGKERNPFARLGRLREGRG